MRQGVKWLTPDTHSCCHAQAPSAAPAWVVTPRQLRQPHAQIAPGTRPCLARTAGAAPAGPGPSRDGAGHRGRLQRSAQAVPRPGAGRTQRAPPPQVNRYTLMNSTNGAIEVKTLSKDQEQDTSQFKDGESGADLEVQEKTALLEWLANSYKNFGCQLEFVTNRWAAPLLGRPRAVRPGVRLCSQSVGAHCPAGCLAGPACPAGARALQPPSRPDTGLTRAGVRRSQEGSQFCRGFGGVGGLLRYAVDPTQFEPEDDGLDEASWGSDSDL